jgi:hypothetical protein
MDGTRSSASGGATRLDDAAVAGDAPIAADVNLTAAEAAPVNAADPRELDGGIEPDLGTRTSATVGAVVGSAGAGTAGVGKSGTSAAGGADRPLDLVREGMKVIDASGDEIGKVEFVKMGDPEAATVSPAAVPRQGGLLDTVADAVTPPDAGDLPEALAGELLRVGYLRIDTKGWFNKDRFVPGDAVSGVVGDTVQLSVMKDELAEA